MNDLRGEILDAVIKILIDHNVMPHPYLVICRFQPFLLNDTVLHQAAVLEDLMIRPVSFGYILHLN